MNALALITATVEPKNLGAVDQIRSALRQYIDRVRQEPHQGVNGTKIVLKTGDLIFVSDAREEIAWLPKTNVRDFPGVYVMKSETQAFLAGLRDLVAGGRIQGLRELFAPMLGRQRAKLTREATDAGYRAVLLRSR